MTLLYLSFAFTVGIAAGSALTGYVLRSEGVLGCSVPGWLYPTLVIVPFTVALLLRSRTRIALLAVIALFLALGGWRYAADPFERCWTDRDLAYYQADAGVWATVEGEVVGFPDVQDDGTRYQVAVERVLIDGEERLVRGRALVEAPRHPVYAYGDTLRVRGLLLTPPVSAGFNYRRFLAIRNIHTLIRRPGIERLMSGGGQGFWRVLYGIRSDAASVINRILPEPAAALANGMVLGIEGGISGEINAAFKTTGTTHLVVISGSNVALLAGALAAVLGHVLSRRKAALVAAPLVLLYVLLVGADPPALRAGVMGLLALGAVFFGRRGTAYVSLCAAGLVMLAVNPLTLWDIGFQLSFMTSLGLILFSRPISRGVLAALRTRLPVDSARRWTAILDGTFVVTVAAQLAVLPLILSYFGRVSPVSLLTNALVLPVQPAVLTSGIAALLAGAAWQPLGQVVGSVPWLLLSYTIEVVRATAAVPFASFDTGRSGPAFVAGYYCVLALALIYRRYAATFQTQPGLRRASCWGALLAMPLCLAFFAWRVQPDGRLHVVFVPGQEAEAAVIIAPNGRTAWVWSGRGDGKALAESTRTGGWVRGRPDVVLANCAASPWPSTPCVDLAELAPGSTIVLVEGTRLTKLSTDGGPGLLLTYGRLRTLLPCALPEEAERSVESASLSLLKAPGPGAGLWPSVEYLRAVQPQLVLWPLETTYPPEVANYLATEVATARVEADAAIEVISDGERFSLVQHSGAAPQ